ncbi:MAG: hypothetical protein COB53_08255 [Elusimicrobia bacterium]|nr:MAG: hypothetical protein COB53_08255 [Elusimicrobiota bacterium]
MRFLLLAALLCGPLHAAEDGEPTADPAVEAPKPITRADLERRIVSLENERNQFQETIDTKISEYNTETEELRTSAQQLEERGYSTTPPDQNALMEAQQKNTEAETRQQQRDAETHPDVNYEEGQIREREQKIGKLRSEVDKMAAKNPQQPFELPDMKPPEEGGNDDGPGDGSAPLPGEDLLMNDQRLDSAGRPTDMSREEMDARYGPQAGQSNAGAMRTGVPGSLGSGRPGSIGRADAASVRRNARTGWIPGGRFTRGGLGGPIAGGSAI